ncbi:MAG: site-specific integrase [Sulfuritalea sp.]|jgi:integrase|nr:site-specific integrase [Sulfuritalea sp.]MBK8762427.1 site-specific integrase [Sulfuritalea sp.]
MATIRQRTSGYWQAIVRRKGAPDQSKTFRKKKDAEAWAATIESEIARGVFVSRDEAEKTTFAKVAERFEEEVLPNKRSGDRDVYRLRQVVEHFGKHTLAAITSSMIAAYRDDRLKTLSPQSVVHEINLLSRIFKACTMDWGINLPMGIPTAQVRKPKVANARERRLESDEEQRIFAAIERGSRHSSLRSVIEFALETGARQSEITSLVWRDVDTEKRVARIRGIDGRETKNRDTFRDVPLSTKAIAVLNGITRPKKGGLVFQTSASSIKQAWDSAIKRARKDYERDVIRKNLQIAGFSEKEIKAELRKIMPRGGPKPENPKPPRKETLRNIEQLKKDPILANLHFHDLRHEATSRLAEKLQMHELMKVTGHKGTAMLARYYHPRAEDLAKKLG